MLPLQSVVVENADLRKKMKKTIISRESTCMSSEPVTTQFFLGTNTAALTGRSQT